MKNKCNELNCKNKANVCSEHYNILVDKKYETETKLINRNFTIEILIFLIIGSLSIFLYSVNDIDEYAFCLNKLNENFPEYNFIKAGFDGTSKPICIGTYQEQNKQLLRDGLKEYNTELNKEKKFELINKKDIDYVESDEDYNLIAGLGIFISILGMIFSFYFWDDARRR